MKDLKKTPIKEAPKKKPVKKITVNKPTDIIKFQVKQANLNPPGVLPATAQQSAAKPTQVSQIIIERIIAHILDPKMSAPTLSKILLNRKVNNEAFDLVQTHIFKIIWNNRTREARFTSHKSTSVCGLSKKACTNIKGFKDASKEMASKLFNLTKDIPNIGKCDLVVCQYHIKNEPERKQLAILKLEISDGLPNLVDPVTGMVDLKNREPFTFRDLQKGVLVQSCDPNLKCHLLILDNQSRPPNQNDVAAYFMKKYLESELISNSIYLTRLLYENLIDIENALFKAGHYRFVELIHKLEEYICTQEFYNMTGWMKDLDFPDDLVKLVEDLLYEDLKSVVTFDIDLYTFRKYLKQARFKGSNGLLLKIPGKSLSMIILPKKPTKPIQITLETNSWTRMK